MTKLTLDEKSSKSNELEELLEVLESTLETEMLIDELKEKIKKEKVNKKRI